MTSTHLDTEILAEFPLTDGGTVKVAREQIALDGDSPVHSFRAVRYHPDGYATQRGEWRDLAAFAMRDGLDLAGWLAGVTAEARGESVLLRGRIARAQDIVADHLDVDTPVLHAISHALYGTDQR